MKIRNCKVQIAPQSRARDKRFGNNFYFAFFNSQFSILIQQCLQRLTPSETGLDIVPPFESISFIRFPAQEHDAAVAHRRKIN